MEYAKTIVEHLQQFLQEEEYPILFVETLRMCQKEDYLRIGKELVAYLHHIHVYHHRHTILIIQTLKKHCVSKTIV